MILSSSKITTPTLHIRPNRSFHTRKKRHRALQLPRIHPADPIWKDRPRWLIWHLCAHVARIPSGNIFCSQRPTSAYNLSITPSDRMHVKNAAYHGTDEKSRQSAPL